MSLLNEIFNSLQSTDKSIIDYIQYDKCKEYRLVENFLFQTNYKKFTKQFFEFRKDPRILTDYLKDFLLNYTRVEHLNQGFLKLNIYVLFYIIMVDKNSNGYYFNTGYQKIYHPLAKHIYNLFNDTKRKPDIKKLFFNLTEKNLSDVEIAIAFSEFFEPAVLHIIFSDVLNIEKPLVYNDTDFLLIQFVDFNALRINVFEEDDRTRKQFLKEPIEFNITMESETKNLIGFNIKGEYQEYVTPSGIFLVGSFDTKIIKGYIIVDFVNSILYMSLISNKKLEEDNPENYFDDYLIYITTSILEDYTQNISVINSKGTTSIPCHRINTRREEKEVLIGYTLRNMPAGWQHSEEAKTLASKLGLTLEPNQTIVKEHIRHYKGVD